MTLESCCVPPLFSGDADRTGETPDPEPRPDGDPEPGDDSPPETAAGPCCGPDCC